MLPTSQGVEVEAALAFAMAGDTARAESLAQDLNKRFPLDTQMQSLWLPAIQAQLALNSKNPAAALSALQAASAHRVRDRFRSSAISPASIRPTFAERRIWPPDRATLPPPSFRRFSTTAASSGTAGRERWRIWEWRVRMPCSRELRRDADADAARVRALAAYKDFLTLWKDADPDIPILKQAKAEYAKLQ